MIRGVRRVWLSSLLAPLLLAACASGGGSRQVLSQTAEVTVENDLRPAREVTVRLSSTSGTRRILGSVPPGGTRSLTVDEPGFSGQYRLIAQGADGDEVQSRQFTLFPGAQVRWTLFSNTLSVTSM